MKTINTLKHTKLEFILGFGNTRQVEAWFSDHSPIKGFALIGRSNVGKSSVINALFPGTKARVSNTPGKTREINIYRFELPGEEEQPQIFHVFDLPGYGHASVSKSEKKRWETLIFEFFKYVAIENIVLINLQDARHPLQKADLMFYELLEKYKLPANLLLNKFDKLKKQKERHQLKKIILNDLSKMKYYQHIYKVSAMSSETFEIPLTNILNSLS